MAKAALAARVIYRHILSPMKKRPLFLALLLPLAAAAVLAEEKPAPAVSHDAAAGIVRVTLGGGPFAEFCYRSGAKPIVWPVHGPGGVALTRDWPMKADTPGEDRDHPHHTSLWFTHGNVNGVDFWAEGADKGTIVTQAITKAAVEDGVAVVAADNHWVAPGGKIVCSDATTLRFGTDGAARFIDYTITVAATEGEVIFGDTKEGTLGLRTRPELNVARKNPLAAGQCVNSEGQRGGAIWGQKAAWVDYWAPIKEKTVGVAIFDHPENLRHPTTWHARDYGLIAANPFGLHDFIKGEPKGAGDFTIKAGGSQTWRYRFYLHEGDAATGKVAEAWKKWAGAGK